MSNRISRFPVRYRVVVKFISGVNWGWRIKDFDDLSSAVEYLKFRVDHPSERTFQVDLSVEFDKNKK